jgi:hypothetical protein
VPPSKEVAILYDVSLYMIHLFRYMKGTSIYPRQPLGDHLAYDETWKAVS